MTKSRFKGIVKLSEAKYRELRANSNLDSQILYVTPSARELKLKDSETIKVYEDPADGLTELMIDTEILNDINMSLRIPASSPATIELVGVDNTKSQKMIEIGEGLVLENSVLKATGGSGSITELPDASNSTAGIIKIATDAEASSGTNELVAVNPKQLKTAIEGLGTVFDLKGTKSTASALPNSGNTIGDVWYVTSEQVAYIWLNDGTSTKWEQFGAPIDLSGYIQTTDIVNNLTSTDSTKPLSAAQGKNLYTMQTNLSNELGTVKNTLSTIETKVDNSVTTDDINVDAIQFAANELDKTKNLMNIIYNLDVKFTAYSSQYYSLFGKFEVIAVSNSGQVQFYPRNQTGIPYNSLMTYTNCHVKIKDLEPNTTYTLSYNFKEWNNWNIGQTFLTHTFIREEPNDIITETFTTDSNGEYIWENGITCVSNQFALWFDKMQLEKGSAATAYVSYYGEPVYSKETSSSYLIWSGELTNSSTNKTITLPVDVNYNDIYEIEYDQNSATRFAKFRVHEENVILGKTDLFDFQSSTFGPGGFMLYDANATLDIEANTLTLNTASMAAYTIEGATYETRDDSVFAIKKIWKVNIENG